MRRYGKLSIRVSPKLVERGFTSPMAWKLANKIYSVKKLPANLEVTFDVGGKPSGPYGEFGWLPLSNKCWIKVRLPKRIKFPFAGMRIVLNNWAEFLVYVFAHEMCHFLDFIDRATTGLDEPKAHKLGVDLVRMVFRHPACLKCKRRKECPTTVRL